MYTNYIKSYSFRCVVVWYETQISTNQLLNLIVLTYVLELSDFIRKFRRKICSHQVPNKQTPPVFLLSVHGTRKQPDTPERSSLEERSYYWLSHFSCDSELDASIWSHNIYAEKHLSLKKKFRTNLCFAAFN